MTFREDRDVREGKTGSFRSAPHGLQENVRGGVQREACSVCEEPRAGLAVHQDTVTPYLDAALHVPPSRVRVLVGGLRFFSKVGDDGS